MNYQFGEHLINAIIPLYEWTIKQLDYRFDVVTLNIIKQHGEQFLLLETTLSQPFVNGSEMITPTYPIPSGVSMPLGNVLLPVVLIFTTVLAWPNSLKIHRAHEYLTRLIISIPLCLFIMLLDMPTQLLKMVWESLNKLLKLNISANYTEFSYWSDFLNGGGLIALSFAAGILAVGITNYLTEPKATAL